MLPWTCPLVVQHYEPPSPRVRSPTLRTSPPVVQHTWSNSYQQQPSSVSTKHTNLPAHIIMCPSPVMNLPAYDNIKHIPNQYQHNKPFKMYHERILPLHHCLAQPIRRQVKWQYRPPGGSTTPSCATTHKTSLFPTIAWRSTLHRPALHQ